MRHLLLRLIINAAALFAATKVGIPGLGFDGDWKTIVVVAFIFGLVNALVRPLLTLLTCPLILVTLGLFVLIINAAMLELTGWIAGPQWLGLGFTVNSHWAAFLGAVVVSIVSWLLSVLLHEKDED
jgi:putative membrane protein